MYHCVFPFSVWTFISFVSKRVSILFYFFFSPIAVTFWGFFLPFFPLVFLIPPFFLFIFFYVLLRSIVTVRNLRISSYFFFFFWAIFVESKILMKWANMSSKRSWVKVVVYNSGHNFLKWFDFLVHCYCTASEIWSSDTISLLG